MNGQTTLDRIRAAYSPETCKWSPSFPPVVDIHTLLRIIDNQQKEIAHLTSKLEGIQTWRKGYVEQEEQAEKLGRELAQGYGDAVRTAINEALQPEPPAPAPAPTALDYLPIYEWQSEYLRTPGLIHKAIYATFGEQNVVCGYDLCGDTKPEPGFEYRECVRCFAHKATPSPVAASTASAALPPHKLAPTHYSTLVRLVNGFTARRNWQRNTYHHQPGIEKLIKLGLVSERREGDWYLANATEAGERYVDNHRAHLRSTEAK